MINKMGDALAAWIRRKAGLPARPDMATSHEWKQWRIACKAKNQFVHWLIEDGFFSFKQGFMTPLTMCANIKHYISNRFISKTHMLKTDLKPGVWHDLDTRLLHGMFNELVEFVEVEEANMEVYCGDAEGFLPWYYKCLPKIITMFFKFRSAEAGLHHLDWESQLTHDYGEHHTDDGNGNLTHQALSAIEIKDMYTWWTTVRPLREDLYASIDVLDDNFEFDSIPIDHIHNEEARREQEDEDMMIRLIKVRSSLWT